jgi:transposase
MSLSVIWLRLPQVETEPGARPRTCPNCSSYILQRWGRITKPVRDTHELEVEIHRYRCCDCGKTFRAYPEGVDRAERSQRMRQLAALAWAMGLSLESVVGVFTSFGVNLSRTTIWRDGQEMASHLPGGRRSRFVRVLNTAQKGVWLDEHQGGVVIVLEIKRRRKVLLEMVGDYTQEEVEDWLGPIANDLGLEMEVF